MPKTLYHTRLLSPWGPLFLAGTEKAVCCCDFVDGRNASNLLARLQKKHCDSLVKEDLNPLREAVDGLNHYFSGELEVLNQPLDLQGTQFQMEVWSALQEIPPGRVATYGELAARVGRPGGARAVGQACGSNPAVLFVPCHRVVAAGGKLGGFGSGLRLKEALLRHEGGNVK
jgi:O-6-methylguanine DNA methyltransferase